MLKQETSDSKTRGQEFCSLLLPLKGIFCLTTGSAMNFTKVQQTYQNEYLPTAELARALASSTWGGPTVACWVVGRAVHHALILRARRAMRPRSRPSARKPGKHAPVQDPSLTSKRITSDERNLQELHGALLTCHSGPSTVASVGMLMCMLIKFRSCSIKFWPAGCGTPRSRAASRIRRAI